MNAKFPGKKGLPEHGEILRKLRNELPGILHRRGFPQASFIANEQFALAKLGISNGRTKGIKIVDALLMERYVPFNHTGDLLLIEVGDYVPSKWSGFSVVHIGYGNIVTHMLKSQNSFFIEAVKAIKEVIEEINFTVKGKTLAELRELVIFTLIGLGLTNVQINDVLYGDFRGRDCSLDLNEDGYKSTIIMPKQYGEVIENYVEAREATGEKVKSGSALVTYLPDGPYIPGDKISIRELQKIIRTVCVREGILSA